MRVRLLGPVDVVADDAPRPVNGQRRKAVLAALALHGGATVSTSRLVDVVWGENAPATAVNTLQSHISYLRGLLGSRDAIRARPPGYFLHLEGHDTDVQLAERLLRRGERSSDPVQGARDLRAALELWRGPSLADLADLEWFGQQADRLEALRLQVRRALLEARMAAGEHAQVLPELERLAEDHPLDEQIYGQLMLALYRCARQADALAVYHRLRGVLSDELGIDPSQPLRALETAILRQDSALDTPAPVVARLAMARAVPVPAQLPSAVPAFTGRGAELSSLDAILAATRQNGPPWLATAVTAVVSGTAGVGKTALAVHWAHRVADQFPDGQLYVNLRGFDPSGQAIDQAEAVRGFLDAFGVPVGGIPASLPAQAALYRSLLAGKRVLLVLDNARDAEQVRSLLPGSPGCLAIVTSRDQLGGLVATEAAHLVTLAPLTVAEARDLLARRMGADRVAAEAGATDDIINGCARLPLALVIAAARVVARQGFPLAVLATELRETSAALNALDGGDVVTDIRAVFSWSCRALSTAAARLFRLLGLHPGPDVSAPAAASLADVPLGRAITLLTELARAHLLTEHAPGRYAFHDLLRAYAAEQAHGHEDDNARSAARQRMLSHYLCTAEAADSRLNPMRDPATSTATSASLADEAVGDYQQALAWFTAERPVLLAAIAQAADFDSYAWRIALALATFLELRGHWQDLKNAHAMALAASRRQGDWGGQGAALRGLGLAHGYLGELADARTHCLLALEVFTENGDHTGLAQTYRSFAWVAGAQGCSDEALDHSRQSLRHYQAAGQLAGQARALNSIGWHLAKRADYEQALAHCQRALIIVRELDDRHAQAHTCDSLGYIYHHMGRHQQAIECYQEARHLFLLSGNRYSEAICLSYLGDVQDAVGEADAARLAWTDALDILSELGHPDADEVRAKLRPRAAADRLTT
jgi:DNA-binding SARP family transcriptional activator